MRGTRARAAVIAFAEGPQLRASLASPGTLKRAEVEPVAVRGGKKKQGFCLSSARYCASDLDREGIGERHFPETVKAARGAGVTGVEVGAKGNEVVVRAQAPQPRDPFRWFPESTRGSVRPASARIAG
jgi:hypothetical protein